MSSQKRRNERYRTDPEYRERRQAINKAAHSRWRQANPEQQRRWRAGRAKNLSSIGDRDCRKCGTRLVLGENITASQLAGANYICKPCVREYIKGRGEVA